MSNTKWTPGPWRLGKIDASVIDSGMTDINAESHGALATAVTLMTDHDESDTWHTRKRAELIANAHLIAAAPDLYEALNEAVKDLICTRNSAWHAAQTDPRWEGVSDVLAKRINACKGALAKALGETTGDEK